MVSIIFLVIPCLSFKKIIPKVTVEIRKVTLILIPTTETSLLLRLKTNDTRPMMLKGVIINSLVRFSAKICLASRYVFHL